MKALSMSLRNIVIGAGGHGKVIADILLSGKQEVLGFLDDNPAREGHTPIGLPVLGLIARWSDYPDAGFIVAIGAQHIRQQIVTQLEQAGNPQWITAIHPMAAVSTFTTIGHGTAIMAGTVINADARIGQHSIINTGATVDHDCEVGDYVHIAPGVNLAGGVRVGNHTLVGAGATIAPYCAIGDNVTIGAGAVVINDIPSGVTVKGVPAR